MISARFTLSKEPIESCLWALVMNILRENRTAGNKPSYFTAPSILLCFCFLIRDNQGHCHCNNKYTSNRISCEDIAHDGWEVSEEAVNLCNTNADTERCCNNKSCLFIPLNGIQHRNTTYNNGAKHNYSASSENTRRKC